MTTGRKLILLAALGSAALLAGAHVFQALGYAPCKLCLWQRGPHWAAVAIGLLARAAAGPAQNLLAVSGHQDKAAMILFATLIINGGLGLTFIPRFGIQGAAMATSAAFAFEALATIVLTRRYFPAAPGRAASWSKP